MDIKNRVREVFDKEIHEIVKARDTLDENSIEEVIKLLDHCTGKVVMCGMGKSGHIGKKISATMSSLGIESYFLHPAEAAHGDLGTLAKEDVLVMISNSGETDEVLRLIPNIKMIGTPIVAVTSNRKSTLVRMSDYQIILPYIEEAGNLKLAPTSSTTVEMVLGDALAVSVSELRNTGKEDFAKFHPAGTLGKNLTVTVNDLMNKEITNLTVGSNEKLMAAITKMVVSGSGAIAVVNPDNVIVGIITDGDLKRYIAGGMDLYKMEAGKVMTKNAVCVSEQTLAVDALRQMQAREKVISVLPVISSTGEVLGMIRNTDILSAGIFVS